MQVIKRNGDREPVKLEKISKRISRQSKDLKNVDFLAVAQKVIQGLHDGVTTTQLDNLAIETSYSLSIKHPEYDKLATRLAVSALHKETEPTFSLAMDRLQENKDSLGRLQPILSDQVYKFIKKNSAILDATIDHKRDYLFDYFGFKTLTRSYLLKVNSKIVERPQYLWMRVACGIHFDDIEAAIQTYHLLSTMQATHATPTLYHSGTVHNQLISCFLLSLTGDRDSIYDIFETVQNCAMLSKYAGGIGLHIHDIRAKNSQIYGTNGVSDGIIPFLKVFNETARAVNQSGRRKGSFAIYIEPWHADIFSFLDLRKNNGKEELRARDLFTAIWAPDLFLKRVEEDGDWYLMDPSVSRGLSKVYDERKDGGSFTDLYNKYVEEGKFVQKIKAREVWQAILVAQMEGGTPYLLAKDACNRKSNQKNIGTIESSNLCLAGDTKVWVKEVLNIGNTFISKYPSQPFEISIENLCERFQQGHKYSIKSFDLKENKVVWRFVKNSFLTKESAKTVKIRFQYTEHLSKFHTTEENELAHGELICTDNHPIYELSNKKFIQPSELNQTYHSNFLFCGKDINENTTDYIYDVDCAAHIESISDNTELIDVYDLTVEGTHCFFANDVLVHNCTEIIEYSSPEEIATCVLASVSLPSCVEDKRGKRKFNFEKLEEITKTLTENLNKVIDINFYPLEAAKKSSLLHRPIGIGIQGLANAFALMRFPWESEEAKKLNQQISETMYYATIKASCELAKKYGAYSSFEGSPLSEGKFQFDLWNFISSNRYDWECLRQDVMKYGVRNSLNLVILPSASTSQILSNTESIEPITSNVYKRQTLSGEFIQINKYLVEDLMELGLWNEEMRQKIIVNNGSIQSIQVSEEFKEKFEELKLLYKTVWEISQKVIIDMAADRGPFICQSQSMNLYIKDVNIAKLSSALMYAWKKGLKTLNYYIRNTASREAIKFTVDKKLEEQVQQETEIALACSIDNREACEMCSA